MRALDYQNDPERGLADEGFVETHTSGVDWWRPYARSYDVYRASQITDVPRSPLFLGRIFVQSLVDFDSRLQ